MKMPVKDRDPSKQFLEIKLKLLVRYQRDLMTETLSSTLSKAHVSLLDRHQSSPAVSVSNIPSRNSDQAS